jgi:WD40 repeat protein
MNTEEEKSKQKPEVYAVNQDDKQGWQFSRRDFLRAAAVASAGLAAAGCAPEKKTPAPSPTPTTTVTPNPTETPIPEPEIDPEEIARRMESCQTAQAHNGIIHRIKISPDGKYLASNGDDHTVKIWSLPDGQLLNTIKMEDVQVPFAFSPDGKTLAVGDKMENFYRKITFYTLPGTPMEVGLHLDNHVNDIAYSPDGKLLACACENNAVLLYSLPEDTLVETFEGHQGSANRVAFSPDGSILFSAGEDGQVGLWSVSDKTLIKMLDNEQQTVDEIALSSDGKRLFTLEWEDKIKVWSLPEGEQTEFLEGSVGFALSPDDKWIASSDGMGQIQILSLENEESQVSLSGHRDAVVDLAISPDGSLLVSAGADGAILFWSFPDGTLLNCAMDLDAMPEGSEGIQYEATDSAGNTVTYTLPCGSPLPAGAVCTCNCVSAGGCSCVGHTTCSCVGHTSCTCVSHVVSGGSHYWHPN